MDCDAGATLQAALDGAVEGDTINVSGTCNERVIVSIGNITIDGGGTASIDGTGLTGPLVQVFASGVQILNLTAENSSSSCIVVGKAGSATIQGITVKNCERAGILVNGSSYALIGK
ncbi:MAG: hypothetical protein O6831_12650, partial [Alphaproteobacteria bacterium]|nr:hypothetical protein [Alphaproteobacteria bacterium]